jgi:hypothetical protein
MHISPEEAFSLLESWRDSHISLRVHLRGRREPAYTTVREIEGSVVRLNSDSEDLQIDLLGADFNGDGRTEHGNRGAYLVCEFGNGDRCSFYVQST